MCDPITIATVGATALSATSSIFGGYSAAAAARSQAAVAQQNKQLALQQTQQVQQQGADEALQKYREIHAVEGQQIAGAAASGLDVDFGTPAGVVAGTATMGQEDANRIRQSVQDRTQSLLIDANNYDLQSRTDKATAANDVTSGWLKAGGTILSGASQLSGKFGPAATSGGSTGSKFAPTGSWGQ